MSYSDYGTPILTGRPVGHATRHVGLDLSELAAEAWMGEAVCSQTDPEEFYPEKGGSSAAAKRICNGCPVKAQCLEFAMEHGERWGIWGGLSPRQRIRLRWDRNGKRPGQVRFRPNGHGTNCRCTDCNQYRETA